MRFLPAMVLAFLAAATGADEPAYAPELEGFDRGLYAGPVGWIDADREDFRVRRFIEGISN